MVNVLFRHLWQSFAMVGTVLVFGGRFADDDGSNVRKV